MPYPKARKGMEIWRYLVLIGADPVPALYYLASFTAFTGGRPRVIRAERFKKLKWLEKRNVYFSWSRHVT